MAREANYRTGLIKRIQERFPECVILPNDPQRIQGIPDILVLFNKFWAALELKRSGSASKRPNQDYYINKFNGMSFGAIIYPENETEVLDAIQSKVGSSRKARIS